MKLLVLKMEIYQMGKNLLLGILWLLVSYSLVHGDDGSENVSDVDSYYDESSYEDDRVEVNSRRNERLDDDDDDDNDDDEADDVSET